MEEINIVSVKEESSLVEYIDHTKDLQGSENQNVECVQNLNLSGLITDTFLQSPLFNNNGSKGDSDVVGKQIIKNLEDEEKSMTNIVLPIQTVPKSLFVFNNLKVITSAWNEFSLKQDYRETFLKGCKWSPDGTCLLTNSNDATMRLFDLPLKLYNCYHLSDFDFPELKPSLRTRIGGLVYDYAWYPMMISTNPDTCCFVTTSCSAPVQLWDAYSGTLRSSYTGYNGQDELHAALSVTFNYSGDLLLCGYKDNVKIFHTDIPGRNFTSISTKDICEQKGIVSCIAVNPSMPNIFAAGTYTKSVGLYSVDGHGICLMTGQKGGLTQLMFSQDGSRVFTAGRKDSEILCWDLRYLGHVLMSMKRPHSTNQRIYFDISSDDQYLLSGSSDGKIYVWDLQAAPTSSTGSENNAIECLTQWEAHSDCANGVSIHRHIPVVATASGQRYIPELVEDNDDEVFAVERSQDGYKNSVKLWWAGSITEPMAADGDHINR